MTDERLLDLLRQLRDHIRHNHTHRAVMLTPYCDYDEALGEMIQRLESKKGPMMDNSEALLRVARGEEIDGPAPRSKPMNLTSYRLSGGGGGVVVRCASDREAIAKARGRAAKKGATRFIVYAYDADAPGGMRLVHRQS